MFAGGPVSRILSWTAIPLDAALLRTFISNLPGSFRRIRPKANTRPRWRAGPARTFRHWVSPKVPSLFGLAPCGVYPASTLYSASGALLPHLFTLTALSVRTTRRYLLCGTCRLQALTPGSRTLSGTLPCGVRTFLPRATCKQARGSGHPAHLQGLSYPTPVVPHRR